MKLKTKRAADKIKSTGKKRRRLIESKVPAISFSFAERFDQVGHVALDSAWLTTRLKETEKSAEETVAGIVQLLRKGLGSRVSGIEAETRQENGRLIVTLGLLLNAQHYSTSLERGPSGDSIEANSFRQFWGEKSELRKFADGAICEAVVWDARSVAERREIPARIVKFLLKRHFSIPESAVLWMSGQLDRFIAVRHNGSLTTGEELSQQLLVEFDQLGKNLRSLTGLPLAINNIQAVAESLRLTDVDIAQPVLGKVPKGSVHIRGDSMVPRSGSLIVPPYHHSFEVQITLESSGSWPGEIEALRHCKTAFYLKMGEQLASDHNLMCVVRRDRLFVLQNKVVFSLVLVVPRELKLLKETVTDTGFTNVADTEESKQLDKHTVALPMLSSTIKGVALQESSYSSVCRLAKRWISSHMLSGHITPEAIELICAQLFLRPTPLSPPQSLICGFLRFLTVLSTHDWVSTPLIVNLNDGLTQDDIHQIKIDFVKRRPLLPPMCLPTSYDRSGTLWTRPHPNGPILERLIRLASSCRQVLNRMLTQPSFDDSFDVLFQPPLNAFDVLIHLRPSKVARRSLSLTSNFKEEYKTDFFPNKMPVVDFEPADCFIADLQGCYDSIAQFFYDRYGGMVIGVVWKPIAFQKTDFKVSKLVGRRPCVDDPKQLETNFDGVIDHFRLIGKGLVESIKVLNPK